MSFKLAKQFSISNATMQKKSFRKINAYIQIFNEGNDAADVSNKCFVVYLNNKIVLDLFPAESIIGSFPAQLQAGLKLELRMNLDSFVA